MVSFLHMDRKLQFCPTHITSCRCYSAIRIKLSVRDLGWCLAHTSHANCVLHLHGLMIAGKGLPSVLARVMRPTGVLKTTGVASYMHSWYCSF
jgi:hypothetical protein